MARLPGAPMSNLWATAIISYDEEHEDHALHPAFEAAGIKHAPCAFSRCPDMDFEHSDAFDRAETHLYNEKENLPVEHIDLSKPIYGFEATADLHTLRRYTAHPESREGLPIVFRHQGKHFILNGHHGLAGALRRGDSGADVHMIDLDKES
jgi:hypothetical protein